MMKSYVKKMRRAVAAGRPWLLMGGPLLFVLAGSGLAFPDTLLDIDAKDAKAVISGTVSPSCMVNDYVVIGWNDLGMHCINPSYAQLAILPPSNNLMVQVIRKGDPPTVVTSGVKVVYAIKNNTTVKGKTDFWQYAKALFDVDLPEGIGLTGNGLSGVMKLVGDHFEARGIPVLPYDDQLSWNPYQKAVVAVTSTRGWPFIKTTEVVLPVSDEINCAKCHAAGGDATVNIEETGTVEGNILAVHDFYNPADDLLHHQPVLCAGCHTDNALGKPGKEGVKSLSLAMHGWHAKFPDAGCYDCHPGAQTQCNRSAINGMGNVNESPNCEACHGTIQNVADSISQGREPWLQEPACEQCHGINYTTGNELYRNSRGHANGKVFCPTCHYSPHAWWPSQLAADDVQPARLQGEPFALRKCSVCHTLPQTGRNPHTTYNNLPPVFIR